MNDYKFSTLEYKRPDLEARREKLAGWKDAVEHVQSYDALRALMIEIDRETCELATQYSIAHIRHTLDTRDEFYEAEIQYLQDTLPTLSGAEVALSEAIAASPYRADIEQEYGKQYFVAMDLQKKLYCEENIPLRQQESRLTNEYQKIMATAEIPFDGKTLNLYGLQKYFEHPDRAVRAAAVKAYSNFYESNEPRLEEIWDELIRIRNQMGKNLGYENYIPVGYLEQGRTDYGEKEVASFREQVRTVLVPLCQKLYDAQARRLGIDHVMCYDEKMVFPDGNAEPAGDDAFMVKTAQKMYHEISPETGEFIDFMIDHELMDLQNKPGKASTGYMTSLPSLKAPFVFSCFNHTIFDMQVLTHELGHAFHNHILNDQRALNRDYTMPVAETASTFNECVVMNAAIAAATDREEKLALIESQLSDATQIICDIYSRYRFESAVFAGRENDFLPADRLCGMMLEAQKQSYGDGLDEHVLHPYMWVCKSHYYGGVSFYNFPYAFGGLFARGLYAQYEKEGESFLPKYKELLHETPVRTVEEAARVADIDLTDKAFWAQGLQILSDEIDQFLELLEDGQ